MKLQTLRIFEYLLTYNRKNYKKTMTESYFENLVKQYDFEELEEIKGAMEWALDNRQFDFSEILISKEVSSEEFIHFLLYIEPILIPKIINSRNSVKFDGSEEST